MLELDKLFDCYLMLYFFYFARLHSFKELVSFQKCIDQLNQVAWIFKSFHVLAF